MTAPATDPARFNGFSQLIAGELRSIGAADLTLRAGDRASLAGWFQEFTAWDLVALQLGRPILAVTYTSLPVGADDESIDDEANRVLGVAKDTERAQAHRALPGNLCRAHVHVQELTPIGSNPQPFSQTPGANSALLWDTGRFGEAAAMCDRMRDSGLYHSVWALAVTRDPFGFTEPSPTLTWDRFAANLCAGLSLSDGNR